MRRAADVDKIAQGLARWGKQARQLPDSGDHYPVVGLEGASLGEMLAGHGLLLHGDLKHLGITKKIPGVIERSSFRRTVDRVMRDQRGALTSLATVQAAAANKRQHCVRDNWGQLNAWFSKIYSTGNPNFPGTATAAPGSAPDRTNGGAWSGGWFDPPAGNTAFIVGFGISATNAVVDTTFGSSLIAIVDVLVECGQINAATTSAQTLNTTALTRYTSGSGVLASWWATDNGVNQTGTTTFTVSYTNQAGTAGQSSTWTCAGAATAQYLDNTPTDPQYFVMPLAAGDYGVRSVQNVTNSVASTTAAPTTYQLLLFKPLLFAVMMDLNVYVERDVRGGPGSMLIPLATTAGGKLGCISAFVTGSGSLTTPNYNLSFWIAEG